MKHKSDLEKTSKSRPVLDRVIHPDAAGIDVGAEELVAAVPAERDQRSVRTFDSFTSSLYQMRDWLLGCGIRTVAMESTGNYWVSAYQILEDAGIEVWLVNARFSKGLPGRKKTDVCDAQWLQQLHGAGLLSKSFRPEKEIAPLRYVMRYRSGLVSSASEQLQLIQKVLTEMNLKLQHVLSDLDGASGRAILEAILAGEQDARKLAALRDKRCKAPLAKMVAALEGDYRQEYLFVLKQCYQRWLQLRENLVETDRKIELMLRGIPGLEEDPGELPAAHKRSQHLIHKNCPDLPIYQEAWRFYGVDLSTIDGISGGLISTLISEVGTRAKLLQSFASSGAFCSWLGLCPDNRISGGKLLKAKTRAVKNRLAAAFRLCAQALGHSKSAMGDFTRRMKGRLGKAEGITATVHKLARIVYGVIQSRKPYDEPTAFAITSASKAKRLRDLQKRAQKLGFELLPIQNPI